MNILAPSCKIALLFSYLTLLSCSTSMYFSKPKQSMQKHLPSKEKPYFLSHLIIHISIQKMKNYCSNAELDFTKKNFTTFRSSFSKCTHYGIPRRINDLILV